VRRQPGRLTRIDRHLEPGDELMASTREELRLNREAYERHFELSRREHQATQAALEDLRDVCRSLVAAVEDNTRALRDLRAEIRAQKQVLMQVLDELRGRGPGGEPATS
jgi:chromosome segregation ATPase